MNRPSNPAKEAAHTEQPTVHVAVGTSLGDRRHQLALALAGLRETPGVRVTRCSHLYETAPVGGVAERRFWNGVLELRVASSLTPLALLDRLLEIEALAGRIRTHRWEDRTLDLDLLLWQERTLQSLRLTVPHPELAHRRFVLVPLVDLVPHQRHPVLDRTLEDLLAELPASKGDVVRLGSSHAPDGWPFPGGASPHPA